MSVPDQYTNLTWLDDDGLYRAWTFSEVINRYYFDDLGEDSFMDTWAYLWAASESDEAGKQESQDGLWEGTLTEL